MVLTAIEMMENVRKKRPLVHHITNYVTVNDCANVTLCAGGSPVMTDAEEDLPEMVRLASAVVLNIGTLNERTVDMMMAAGQYANRLNRPVILDPVGVGATRYRTETVEWFLEEITVDVIKGNAGEIAVLADMGGEVRGVDSGSKPSARAVRTLAENTEAIVASTGEIDFVSDGSTTYQLMNGHPMMDNVSGTGCMLSSVVGCYTGANGVSIDSVASALSVFSIAGEIAAERSAGPGTFKMNLMDTLYSLNSDEIAKRIRTAIM